MKKDNLERFIRDNREAFDDKEPSNALWEKIEAGLGAQPPEQTSPFRKIYRNAILSTSPTRGLQIGFPALDWRVAASIAVLLLAGCFLYVNQQYGVVSQPNVVAASPAYAREVVQYTRLIDDKRMELKQLASGNPDIYQAFSADLDRLEKSYRSLKADLPQNPNQTMLIQAMIQNLQLQINLLNEQLRVIERIKQQTNETNPV